MNAVMTPLNPATASASSAIERKMSSSTHATRSGRSGTRRAVRGISSLARAWLRDLQHPVDQTRRIIGHSPGPGKFSSAFGPPPVAVVGEREEHHLESRALGAEVGLGNALSAEPRRNALVLL